MSWLIFILISISSYSISAILQKLLMKDQNSDPITYSIFFQIFVGTLIGIVGLFNADMSLVNLNSVFFNLCISIMLYAIGGIFIFKSLQSTELSQFTVIFSSRAIFTLITSSLFIQEDLSMKQLAGTALVMLGIIFATNVSFHKMKLSKGQLFVLISAICFGIANTNDRFLLQQMNVYPFTVISFIVPAILTTLIFPKKITSIHIFFEQSIFLKMTVLCIIYAISAITFFIALQIAPNSSQVVTVNQLVTILTTILGIIILKERIAITKKIIGAILSVIGVLCII